MIRDRDGSTDVLGPPEPWPESLKTALSLVLNSPESMILAWGPELSFGGQVIKVLFVTGYAANAAVGAGHLDKDMEVLTKPFNVSDLTRKVNDIRNR